MSVSSQSSPIDTLDYDTLLHVFMMNTNIFLSKGGDKALPTTWATSQVCQRWREMMLNTSSLWAKVIYIDSSCWHIGAEWWKELMRRTGTALLWIRVNDFQGLTKSVFAGILHENWSRIKKLKMDLEISDSSHFPSWETFSHPAPVLETFDVWFDIRHPVVVPDYTLISPLFSGYAPKLRRFMFPFKINEHVPWLNHLYSIEFHGWYSVSSCAGNSLVDVLPSRAQDWTSSPAGRDIYTHANRVPPKLEVFEMHRPTL